MTHTSGPPYEWEFNLIDPATFSVPRRAVKRVFLHNTGWDSMSFRGPDLTGEVNRWHMAEGLHGIGFHYVVDKYGNITTGRPLEAEPMEQAGRKSKKTIDIAVQGLWHFTQLQLQAVQVLCHRINEAYHDEHKEVTFHGLCEIAHVPSPMFDYGKLLGLDLGGHMSEVNLQLADDVANRASFFVPVAGNA